MERQDVHCRAMKNLTMIELAQILKLPENEEILMLLDLGTAAEGTMPLPNHNSRKNLTDTVTYI